ncbi:MAG: nickel-responsive transcriptional regulator NikR [Candidatus Eisenbacteria bacterium]
MKNHSLCRFSISMRSDLVAQLDVMAKTKGYPSRSQALADLVSASLVEHHAQVGTSQIAGTVTLVYDHHKPGIQALLTGIQHHHQDLIVAALHVHLDHRNCLEVLALRGRADAVRKLADRLIAVKGIKHGRLTVTTTGKQFRS